MTSRSILTPADTSQPSWSSGHFPDFPWSGSPWLAHGSPLHGDWFANSTGLLLGVICHRSFPDLLPRDVPFPFATSRHRSGPTPRVPSFPVLLSLLGGPSHTLFLVPSPFPIPHPVFIPLRAASNPVARAPWILIHPGTFSCALQGSLPSRPLVFGWFVSFWNLLGALLPGPAFLSQGTRAYSPPGHLLCFSPCRALPVAPHLHSVLLPVLLLPVRFLLCVLQRCILDLFGFFGFFLFCFSFVFCGLPPSSFPLWVLPCSFLPLARLFVFFYPPPCMQTQQHSTGHRITAPVGVCLRSPRPRGACPWAVPGQARWALLPPVSLLSSLSSLPPPPLVACLLPALLLLLFCSMSSPLLFPTPGLYLLRSHAPLGLRRVPRPVG